MPAQNEVSLQITIDDQGTKTLTEVIRLLKELQDTVRKTANSFKDIEKSTDNLNRALGKTTTSTKQFEDRLDRLQREFEDTKRSTDRAEASMLDYSVALGAVSFGLSRVRDFGARQLTSFVQASSRLEDVTAGFTSMLGSVNAANDAISRLRQAAQDPGLTFEVAARATRRFVAFGVPLERAIQLTRNFANAAVLSGTSTAELDTGLQQLAKAIGNSKLEADDLSSILERFGPIGTNLRSEFGKTAEEINKSMMAANRSILEVFESASSLEKQPVAAADTLSQAVSNLQNAWNEFSTDIGDVLLPVVTDLIELLTDLLEAFNDLPPPIKEITAISGTVAFAITGIGTAAFGAAASVGALTLALGGAGVVGGGAAAGVAGGGLIGALTTGAAALKTFLLGFAGIAAITASLAGLVTVISEIPRAIRAGEGLRELRQRFDDLHAAGIDLQRVINSVTRENTNSETATKNAATTYDEFRAILQKATGDSENFGTAQKTAADETNNLADALTKVNRVQRPSVTRPPTPSLPSVSRPAIAGRRAQTRAPVSPQEIGRTITFAEEQAREGARIIQEQWDETEKRISENVAEIDRAWLESFRHVGTLSDQSTQRFISNSNRILQARRQEQIETQAQINLEVARNNELTAAATRQFEQLGLLDNAQIRAFTSWDNALHNLTDSQDLFTQSISESVNQFNFLISSIQRLFAAVNQGTRSGVQGQTGFGTGFIQFTNALLEIGQIVATGSRLFHDPANDRLAELAGLRAGNVGAIRAASRQSARDFSDSFGRGFERAQARVASTDDHGPTTIINQIVVDDNVVSEQVNVINRMLQTGEVAFRSV